MEQALFIVKQRLHDDVAFEQVKETLADARSAYLAGNKRAGAHFLQAIDRVIHPSKFVEYEKRKGLRD